MSTDFSGKRTALSLNSAYDALPEEQIKKNLTMKGWLKKKSPHVLKSWQKRYFMTLEHTDGWRLVYFENDKTDSKPKGAFNLRTFSNITIKDKRIMVINFPQRELELKAKTPELCQQWITVLNACKITVQKKREHSINLPITTSDESPTKGGDFKGHDHKQIDTKITQAIQIQKEKDAQEDAQHSKNAQKKLEKQAQEHLSNENMLELVGLKDYIKKMNENFITNRMIYGYIGKRSKGKVKYFQKRWFLLVSAKSLYPELYNDEKILFEQDLPPWLELDTLLYFKVKDENKAPKSKGNIKMIDCQEIILKNMQKSKESGFTFKINMGDRLYHLMTDTEQERKKWQTALSHSILTTKEINNLLKLKIKKNIDLVLKMYDVESSLPVRREKLKAKIETDIAKIQKRAGINPDNYNSDFQLLLNFLTLLSQDMLESLQACVVKDPQRKDIMKEYIDIVHERICDLVTNYWDSTYQTIDSPSMLQLAQWLNVYSQQLQDFFNDDRLQQGIRVLLGIFVNRSLENLEPIISGIVEQEKKSEPFKNDQDHLVTQSPVDLFKLINEGFDTAYNLCKCRETVQKMAHYGKQLIFYYSSGLEEMIVTDETQLTSAKLIASCNNTVALREYTKAFAKRLQVMGGYTEEECDKVFDTQKITKQFVSISDSCREKFFIFNFGSIQRHFKKFYLELQMMDVLKQIIGPGIQELNQLHDSFSRKIWKQLAETIVIFYFNSLIVSCSKTKKEHQDLFVEKLEQDKELLLNELDSFMFQTQLQQVLKPFDDMSNFLQEDSLSILEPCKNLRVYFGKAFTEKTIRQIFNIRFDLEKDRKSSNIDSCKAVVEKYNKENRDENLNNENSRLLDVLGLDEEEGEQTKGQEQQQSQKENRRKDINLDISDENQEDNFIPERDVEEETKKDYIEEGYLYKQKPNQQIMGIKKIAKWDYRYFRIRKGHLYWEAQNKLDLQMVDDVYAHQTKPQIFFIQLEGGKKYKFKAEGKEERDLWIKSLEREQTTVAQQQLQKFEAITRKQEMGRSPQSRTTTKSPGKRGSKGNKKSEYAERWKRRMKCGGSSLKAASQTTGSLMQLSWETASRQGRIIQSRLSAKIMKMQDCEIMQHSQKKSAGCWDNFLVMLGLKRPS